MRLRWGGSIQIEGPVVRVLTVGALEARDGAHVCRVFLVERRQALTLKPRDGGVNTGRARTLPVDHGAGGRGPLCSAGVRVSGLGVPPRSIVAALLLLTLALGQRRVPLSLAWKQRDET